MVAIDTTISFFLIVDWSELNLVVMLVHCSLSSEETWLGEKHNWDINDNNNKKSKSNAVHLLLLVKVWNTALIIAGNE